MQSCELQRVLLKILHSGRLSIAEYVEEVDDFNRALILWQVAVPNVMLSMDKILKFMGEQCTRNTKLLHEDTQLSEENMRMAYNEITKIVETVQRLLTSRAQSTVTTLREIRFMARRVQELVVPVMRRGMPGSPAILWFFRRINCFCHTFLGV